MGGPGYCGSVDWVPACEPKGHWFNSQSGHMPGLWVGQVPGTGCVRGNQLMYLSHIAVSRPLFLPPPLSINK